MVRETKKGLKLPSGIIPYWPDEEEGYEEIVGYFGRREKNYIDASNNEAIMNLRREGLLNEVCSPDIF
jgi:hypothetical protein|tara:strand:- start:6867 stop:7070 length:204 start_codon:yes stop_codon:yes gene_type:complete